MTRTGRAWAALTAAVAAGGTALQVVLTATTPGGYFPDNPGRALNLFAFFTIQSNLILAATAALLALGRHRDSVLFRVLRLDGVICIAVTGIVYHVALAGLDQLTGTAVVANFLLHTAAPVLGVLGWLLFGPRARIGPAVVGWSVAYPLLWLAFTLVRGAPTGFYPYPFVDVDALGYGRVLLNCLVVAVLFLALAFGALGIDRLLTRHPSRTGPGR